MMMNGDYICNCVLVTTFRPSTRVNVIKAADVRSPLSNAPSQNDIPAILGPTTNRYGTNFSNFSNFSSLVSKHRLQLTVSVNWAIQVANFH